MRVIAGKYKGRRLVSPADSSIRPTGDKVKGALFSVIAEKVPGGRILDLFSGTGNLGIEALSRGASSCVFADRSPAGIRIIKENIAHCRIEEEVRVYPGDFRKVLMNQRKPFDVILLDPPYDAGAMDECFRIIREQELLAEGGIIVAEHGKREELPERFHGFTKEKDRKYGVAVLSIYS